MAGSARDRRRDWATGRGGPRRRCARRRELIDAAAMAARLQQNAYDRFEDAVAGYFGVNRTAMRCLEVLDRLGQQTAGEIATQTGLTSGAVTAMLDRLERAGLVRRLADASDRRRVLVQMTDRAAQLAATSTSRWPGRWPSSSGTPTTSCG